MSDRQYWAKVNSSKRAVKCRAAYSKEVPRGVAKIPFVGKPVAEIEVSDAEWRYRHWCDRVMDVADCCEYCQSGNGLTAVAMPGVSMEDAVIETLVVMCPGCIQDAEEMAY